MSNRKKAYCPDNPDHDRFIATAHVVEDWIVDREGNWMDTNACTDTLRSPSTEDVWTCAECYAEAVFK